MSHFPVFKNYDAVANYPFWSILFDGYVKTAVKVKRYWSNYFLLSRNGASFKPRGLSPLLSIFITENTLNFLKELQYILFRKTAPNTDNTQHLFSRKTNTYILPFSKP